MVFVEYFLGVYSCLYVVSLNCRGYGFDVMFFFIFAMEDGCYSVIKCLRIFLYVFLRDSD